MGGVVGPLVAFFADLGMHVNPLLWGGSGLFGGGAEPQLGLRHAMVYSFVAASIAGLFLLISARGSRWRTALAIPLLVCGVALSGLHALAFIPILPASVIGLLVFIGVLGLTPYFALWCYLDALWWAIRSQAKETRGSLRWVLVPLLSAAIPLAGALLPIELQRRALEEMRKGGAADVSRGMRHLGPLASLSRPELQRLYTDLDAEGQVRMRNLYLERFGRDLNKELRLISVR